MAPDDTRPPRLRVHLQRSVAGVRAPGLATWLAATAPASARGEVTVALLPDARVRALNRRFRGQDHVTDVLSFHSEDRSRQTADGRRQRSSPEPRAPSPDPPYLGDIVIAAGLAARQAREAGHSVSTEVRILALHGLLHLVGYDHERASDRGRMDRAERRLRTTGGLPAGLIERGGRR